MQTSLKKYRIFNSSSRGTLRSSMFCRLACTLMMICFIFGSLTQPVQAAVSVSVSDSESKEKDRTTMYVSSALTGRHGLCVLLENVDSSGNRKYGLIDTGNPNTAAAKVFLNKHGVKSLDFLILTHMHRDHAGNAVWIIKNYRVRQLYLKQFDAAWSDGDQYLYESVLRAALTSPYVQQIHGVSYALSQNKTASPKATKGFLSFLKSNENRKWRFKGLFNSSNTALYLGQTSLRLFNWEIWADNGTSQWVPGKNTRCKAQKYTIDRSDNHFSMGVRVTRGSHKIWIGGDITNLRLRHKRHSSCKGDEDRLGKQIGKVDVAVLNHHGRGGSNSKSFLKALSPSYVIYTSTKVEINSAPRASSTLKYIRRTMKLPESHIIWAFDCWGIHCKDPAVTLSSKAAAPAAKNKTAKTNPAKSTPGKNTTAKSNPAKNAPGKNTPAKSTPAKNDPANAKSTGNSTDASSDQALAVPLLPGQTYSSYDLTGDGKKDIVSISSTKSGDCYKGLSISINKSVVWATKVSFKDSRPLTLVRLPGRQPYLCICIMSPVGNNPGTRAFGLYRCERQAGSGPQYRLVQSYSFLKQMPISRYTYKGAPAITCSANRITVVTSGSDTLSASAYVSFVLEQDKNGLKTAAYTFPYTTVAGQAGTVTLNAPAKLYSYVEAEKSSAVLAKGSKVTVTGVFKNKSGITRYRIIDSSKKVWWIDAPGAAK